MKTAENLTPIDGREKVLHPYVRNGLILYLCVVATCWIVVTVTNVGADLAHSISIAVSDVDVIRSCQMAASLSIPIITMMMIKYRKFRQTKVLRVAFATILCQLLPRVLVFSASFQSSSPVSIEV
jgi:hypothetical protein